MNRSHHQVTVRLRDGGDSGGRVRVNVQVSAEELSAIGQAAFPTQLRIATWARERLLEAAGGELEGEELQAVERAATRAGERLSTWMRRILVRAATGADPEDTPESRAGVALNAQRWS